MFTVLHSKCTLETTDTQTKEELQQKDCLGTLSRRNYQEGLKRVVIPPTYEVCGYTPDIRSMWGYNVFAFPFVRTYVHSFAFLSQGQSFCVKVYKTSYFEDPLMDFIHIWHDGRYSSKVFISTIPTPGVTLGLRSRT